MKPKDFKLKIIDLADEMLDTIEKLDNLEDRMKVVSFSLLFWQEQAENIVNYTRASGEVKEMARKGLEKQKALLREKIKSEK